MGECRIRYRDIEILCETSEEAVWLAIAIARQEKPFSIFDDVTFVFDDEANWKLATDPWL